MGDMGVIVVLVFLGVFGVVALVASAVGSGASQQAKQVHATLDSALATESPEDRGGTLDFRKSEQFSTIPWLNQRLSKIELGPRVQSLLYQADLKWNAGGLLSGCGLAAVLSGFLVYLKFNNFLISLGVGLLFGAAPFGFVAFKRSQRLDKFQQGLPEALDLMVSALRAGHSLVAAMGSVARECADPIGCEFKSCFEEQNYGLEMKTALDNMINRVPLQDLRIVATAILIQKESGGNLAEVLDKTSHVVRERFRLKRQVQVHTAQGRMTGWVLTCLPIGLGVALYIVNPTLMSILWTTQIGKEMLWASFGMLVVGGLIIRHIVNMEV
ncbi:MAG: type II secretion system F family protein [Terracidiphilus sp.]|jgi:tight adherence protein B